MTTEFRIERFDGRNENGSVALHVALALDVTNRSDLDNHQGRLHLVAVRAGAKSTETAASSTSSRSSCSISTGETRLPADHGCAEATAQGGRRLGVRIRPVD